jgi:hypothetical protein
VYSGSPGVPRLQCKVRHARVEAWFKVAEKLHRQIQEFVKQ